MEIRQLSAHDYDDIFALSQFAFQYKLSKSDIDDKKAEADRHTIWGYMDGEEIAAKLHLIPLTCYIGGKPFKMGGISSVATWPEYRRQGMVKKLLYHALKHMKQTGQTVSFLHPFSFSFYHKFGWAHVFNQKHYSIPVDKMKGSWNGKGYVRRGKLDTPLLNAIYTDYAQNFSGTLKRDEKWWKQRVFKKIEDIAIAYSEDDTPEGYIHYQVQNDVLTVKELVYRNWNGWKLLLELIANHDSMVETIEMDVPENDPLTEFVYEPRFEQQIQPFFMARIVDVLSFLRAYPYSEANVAKSISLNIVDEFFPENDGHYTIKHDGEHISVERKVSIEDTNVIHCSIQQLTKMFMGYVRPMDLYYLGLISGSKVEVEKLDNILPNQQTYFTAADFF